MVRCMNHNDLLDRAFERLHATDFEYDSEGLTGLFSHGTMAAESLLGLGRPDRIEPFVTAYLGRLRPLTPASREAVARHERRLGDGDYRPALREALGELLPGAVGGAAHGWLRTAHAVRALAGRDVPVRRRELAFGLASWAACIHKLPGTPGARPQRARLPRSPRARRRAWMITT
jgi:hypothetical protein